MTQKPTNDLPVGLTYHKGRLTFDGQNLAELAEKFSTPLYVYSQEILTDNARRWCNAMHKNFRENGEVAYAVKANNRIRILQTLASIGEEKAEKKNLGKKFGCGADVVSRGELLRALASGISPQKIVFSGCGKSEQDIACALENGVTHINVESEAELLLLSQIATQKGVIANVSLRITPDIDAETHHKISTARKKDKFGIEPQLARELYRRKIDAIDFDGIAIHIGSQITKIKPFQHSFAVIAEWLKFFEMLKIKTRRIDIGGGSGIDENGNPTPSPEEYALEAKKFLDTKDTRIIVEPGRSIAASAGLIVTKVLAEKTVDGKKCLVLDVGMNDFMRVALYDARHKIVPLEEAKIEHKEKKLTWAVGPVCESSDNFAMQPNLEKTKIGDLLALTTAGAYGAVMASNYCARAMPAEVIIATRTKGKSVEIIRSRGDILKEIESEKKIADAYL